MKESVSRKPRKKSTSCLTSYSTCINLNFFSVIYTGKTFQLISKTSFSRSRYTKWKKRRCLQQHESY